MIKESFIVQNQSLEKEKEDLTKLNKEQQAEIMNLITQRDEANNKLTLETSTLRVTIADYERKEQQQVKDTESFLAKQQTLEKEKEEDLMIQNKQQHAEIINLITQRDEANNKLTIETSSLRVTIADYERKAQQQVKDTESLLAEKLILEKEKKDLTELSKRQQAVILNIMTHCDETKDKLTTETSTLRVSIADHERKAQQQMKDTESLLAKKQILEKEKEDLMTQNKQQQAEIINLITQRDEAKDMLTVETSSLLVTIADYEHKVQELDKEMASLLAKNQTLEMEKEDLTKQHKGQDAEIMNLIKQHDEAQHKLAFETSSLRVTIADYEHKVEQQDKDKESLMAKNQSLKDDMANQITQHDEVQTSSNAQIASLRTTIANYERKDQLQQKKHDTTLKDQIGFTYEQQEESGHSTRRLIYHNGPVQIVVRGAGTPEVNGLYSQDGYSENAFRYSRRGKWEGKNCMFYILQCQVNNNKKYWYITIAPDGCSPGNSDDIDFYFAPVNKGCRRFPPWKGWVKDDNGRGLPPTISYRTSNESSGGPGKESLSASQPFLSAARTEASETQNQEPSNQSMVLAQEEHAWSTMSKDNKDLTKQNELLIEKNKRYRADLDDLIQQHDEKEKKSKAEINSLRTAIAAYEHKERAQLKARIEVLRGKAGHYAQKEKKAKIALQEMVALEEQLSRKGKQVVRNDDDDTLLVHETTPFRNAKRARHDGSSAGSLGQDGESESSLCDQQG